MHFKVYLQIYLYLTKFNFTQLLDTLCLSQPSLPSNDYGPIFLPKRDVCHGKVLKLSGGNRQGIVLKLSITSGIKQSKVYLG